MVKRNDSRVRFLKFTGMKRKRLGLDQEQKVGGNAAACSLVYLRLFGRLFSFSTTRLFIR